MDGAYICKPGHPLTEDKNVGRHPLLLQTGMKQGYKVYQCTVCRQSFTVNPDEKIK